MHRRRSHVLAAGVLAVVTVASRPAVQGADVADGAGAPRRTISLDGPWHVIVDPYENGFYDYRLQPHPDGYFRDAKPRGKSDRLEYDFDASPTLDVPGDWNGQRPELLLYEGTVWYERKVDWQPRRGRRVFLRFGAAAQRAVVWLNGQRLGEHEGGFTPFQFEVTAGLRRGTNSVVVKVDNTRRREAVPTVNTDWWNYGGLTREVSLDEVPETFVQAAFVQLGGGAGEIDGWVQLDGPRAAGQTVAVELPEAGVRVALTADAHGRAALAHLPAAALARWSPESPRLYDVVVRAGDDVWRDRIGFRTIAVKAGEILLNGAPVFLRGISMHEEAPGGGHRAHGRADAETLLGRVKELGCNFVRLAHYPHDEEMVRAADRLGLLVWSEVPVYWTIAWDAPATLANARAQLGESVARDRNRAAVALWSVANETPVSPARTAFLRALIADVRAADPTRLVTAALEHHYVDARTVTIDDPLAADLDVIGCNEYIGWYDGLPAKCDGITWKNPAGKPVVMSEFGGDALAGRHGDALTRWSEEFQEDLYRRQLAMLGRIPFLRGMSPWILVDFRSPRRHLPGVQDMWNRKGLMAPDGTRKKAYFVLQRFYRERAAAAAPPPPRVVPAP